jgi:hypothetical protein
MPIVVVSKMPIIVVYQNVFADTIVGHGKLDAKIVFCQRVSDNSVIV